MNQFPITSRTAYIAAAFIVLGIPLMARAESNVQTGVGAASATAHLDFRVTVPKVLFLQVGTGTLMASNPTINLIDFNVPAANVGDGNSITATAASGDIGNGTVTAKVVGNSGNVTLTATTVGALSNGAGDTLSFAEIGTAVSALTSPTPLAAPALLDGATSSTVVPPVGKVVSRDARWTFSYLNTTSPAAGTYGGVNTNNGRVTYTASMP
jgi:hypothetical protein